MVKNNSVKERNHDGHEAVESVEKNKKAKPQIAAFKKKNNHKKTIKNANSGKNKSNINEASENRDNHNEHLKKSQPQKQSNANKHTSNKPSTHKQSNAKKLLDKKALEIEAHATTDLPNQTKQGAKKSNSGKAAKSSSNLEKRPENKKEESFEYLYGKRVSDVKKDKNAKVRIIPLGGLNEIGKNMTAIECGEDIIVIDCGLAFPDEETPGVDLVIPDITYLEANSARVRGIVLTHGHEDHIGAIPYVLRNINPPIYGTKLTLGIVRNKLKEFALPYNPKLVCVSAGDIVNLGGMSVEFIHVNHSIADACALAIKTPLGTIVHSGDFKLDLTPIDGEIMDVTRLGELGREGVLLLMCESTNAERPGYTPSERKVGASLEYIFTMHNSQRIVIATFSSNVHRVQQVIDTAARHGRKVAVMGRSMLNIVGAAVELGYMRVPEGVLIDISEVNRYRPDEIVLVTTGSQGEPMSALYRMAFGEHKDIKLGVNDVVVISSSAIPGNEKLVGRIINELCKIGVEVIHDAAVEVHVSGHACQEEIKLMQALTKPKYFMPVHGEYKHLSANRDLAISMRIDPKDIFIADIGSVLEIDKDGARISGTVTSGRVLIDGYGVGDVGNIVLRDRLLLSQDGLIVVVATVSSDGGYLISGPDIVSRGFVYVRESEDLMEEMRQIALEAINSCLSLSNRTDWYQIKGKVKEDLAKFIMAKTKRKPMIIPMIMNV